MNLPFQTCLSQIVARRAAVAGVLLAACTLIPAVPARASALGDGGTSAVPALDAGCAQTAETRESLGRIAQELRSQGMALEAICQPGAAGWVVKVRVVDGTRAARAVRGPLADGHEVDMGTPAGVPVAHAQADAASGFSPDVQYNRQWLRTLMARHQFDNVPRAWWLFAERGTGKAGPSQIAAR
ncbi:D-Ala-D-Ala dipeptidase [Acidovorax sp. BL-A-41-H1]|uniref:D-Ala-D-Ala dipeptidase n=1 Tax=Acidovorax sp. BL-A-41-H1 TaxID=3421102 RepID=UPI003F7ADEF5